MAVSSKSFLASGDVKRPAVKTHIPFKMKRSLLAFICLASTAALNFTSSPTPTSSHPPTRTPSQNGQHSTDGIVLQSQQLSSQQNFAIGFGTGTVVEVYISNLSGGKSTGGLVGFSGSESESTNSGLDQSAGTGGGSGLSEKDDSSYEDNDFLLHDSNKRPKVGNKCDECKKGDIKRAIHFRQKENNKMDLSQINVAPLQPPTSNPKPTLLKVYDTFGSVFNTLGDEDHCLITNTGLSDFENHVLHTTPATRLSSNGLEFGGHGTAMSETNNKVVYQCDPCRHLTHAKIGRVTCSRDSYNKRYDGCKCNVVFDLDRTTTKQRQPIEDSLMELHQDPKLGLGSDWKTLSFDQAVAMQKESGVNFGFNVGLSIYFESGPFQGTDLRKLRGQGVGHTLHAVETGSQVSLFGNPQNGLNGAMHELYAVSNYGPNDWENALTLSDHVETNVQESFSDLEKLMCIPGDYRTCNTFDEVRVVSVMNIGSWAPTYENEDITTFDYDTLVNNAGGSNTVEDAEDYSYLEDDANTAGGDDSNSGSGSGTKSVTTMMSDDIYGSGSYTNQWVDIYTKQVSVWNADNEYDVDDHTGAFENFETLALKSIETIPGGNPIKTLVTINVNMNGMMFKNIEEYESALDYFYKIGFGDFKKFVGLVQLCKYPFCHMIITPWLDSLSHKIFSSISI